MADAVRCAKWALQCKDDLLLLVDCQIFGYTKDTQNISDEICADVRVHCLPVFL